MHGNFSVLFHHHCLLLVVGRRSETDGGLPDVSHGYTGDKNYPPWIRSFFQQALFNRDKIKKDWATKPHVSFFAAPWWKAYEQEG